MGMWSSVQSRKAGAQTISSQHAWGHLAVCQVFGQHSNGMSLWCSGIGTWLGACGITQIARKYLKIAALRYVDDLFAAERRARYFNCKGLL